MKRVVLLFAMALGVASGVQAKPVSVESARIVATNFLNQYASSRTGVQLTLTTTHYDAGTQKPLLYIFNASQGKGFVIVAADDKSVPVLGYSAKNTFPETNVSPEANYWIEGYKSQISYAIAHDRKPLPSTVEKWSYLLQANGNTAMRPTGVSPMIETEWDQSPYYNLLCPTNTPTGCVATAMAQIMKFWDNPTTGTGSHTYNTSTQGGTLTADFGATTYDWANMPNVVNAVSSTTEKNAVATLMFHCGVAVEMDYDINASGAQVIDMGIGWPCSENALKDHFGYKSTIKGYQRSDFSDTQWNKMLKFELDNGRPVLYAGFGQVGGHAFDFDGYDDNGFFHINWGWGGLSDGYFVVDDLSPSALGTGGGGGNFNFGQQALIMIEPASSVLPANPFAPDFPNPIAANLALNSAIVASDDTIVFNTPYSVNVDVINNGPDSFKDGVLVLLAIDLNEENGYLINGIMTTLAPQEVFPFEYTTSGNTDLIPGYYYMGYFYGTDVNNLELYPIPDGLGTNETTLTVIEGETGIDKKELAKDISAFPNPAKEFFNLDWKSFNGKVNRVSLVNLAGSQVYNMDVSGATNCKIPVAQYAAGMYMLRIETDKGTLSKKFVIKK